MRLQKIEAEKDRTCRVKKEVSECKESVVKMLQMMNVWE